MILDLDIYRSAQMLVKQHGEDAPIEAAIRADAMLEKGDLDGYAVPMTANAHQGKLNQLNSQAE